ncbi:hypothetical protein, partial [Cumulibacter manganitolerans]|uniref:hypothetical protein n=1 Tax=Cumulibacter manganitolerans TaxID=1884992 RepID=UPI001295A1B4
MSLLVACLRAVRVRAFAVLAVPLALLLIGSPAYADPATEADAASAAFEAGTHVYVAPGAGQQIDASAVTGAIGSDPVYVAVVPPNTPPPDVLTQLQSGLTLQGTFVVVSGTEQSAFTNVICSDKAQPLLDDAAKAESKTRAAGDLTPFLTTYVDKVADAPKPGDAGCAEAGSGSGIGSALPWILGALLLGGGGGYLWLRSRRQQKATRLAGRRRQVTDALDALARDIDVVADRGGPHVQRALDVARERHIAAADILADADHDADVDA